MTKYELIKCQDSYQIKALRDIGDDVKKGDLGGCVENEDNLSQEDEAWIYVGARAQGNSRVLGNVHIVEGTVVEKGDYNGI